MIRSQGLVAGSRIASLIRLANNQAIKLSGQPWSEQAHHVSWRMIEPNQTALIVKVTRADTAMPDGRVTVLYAVIAEDADNAVRLVKEAVKEDAEVELTEARLSQDTAQMIGLTPGYVRAM